VPIEAANTAAEAAEHGGSVLCQRIAEMAQSKSADFIGPDTSIDIVIIDRAGTILAVAE